MVDEFEDWMEQRDLERKNNMASIRERNGKFNVIYSYTNEKGERKKWETYGETKAEAKRRKKEIEYKKRWIICLITKNN